MKPHTKSGGLTALSVLSMLLFLTPFTSLFAATPLLALPALKAPGLVGADYVSLTADLGNLRSPLTSNTLYGATLGANAKVLPFLDLGGTVRSQRLADNKVDINNLAGVFNATAHKTLLGVTSYLRAGLGWTFNRLNTKRYQALAVNAGAGVEVVWLKNLTVGGEVYLDDVRKAKAGATQVVYKPYAVFWLNDYLGLEGSAAYAKQANSLTYSAGTVLRF